MSRGKNRNGTCISISIFILVTPQNMQCNEDILQSKLSNYLRPSAQKVWMNQAWGIPRIHQHSVDISVILAQKHLFLIHWQFVKKVALW